MATSYITDFIQSLSPEEIKIAKEYIFKSTKKPKSENKLQRLFDVLIQNPQKKFSDPELSTIVDSDGNAIRTLKSRMFDKVKEALLSYKHLENSGTYSDHEKVAFSLKKDVIFVRVLMRSHNQGRTETINAMLGEIIKIAKEYELFEILREALLELKNFTGLRKGIQEFERIHAEMIFYDHCFRCVKKANDAFFRLTLNEAYTSTLTQQELEKHINDSITHMELDYKKTKSSEVNYYIHLLMLALYEKEKKFKNAVAICLKILNMAQTNKVLHSKRRISYALSNLSIFHCYLKNNKKAVSYAQKVQKYIIPSSFDFLISKEQEFYALFYGKKYNEALLVTKEMIQHPINDIGGFRQSKFFLQQSYVHFILKNFKEAVNLLNKSLELEKDKGGWNIALRILITMIYIECNKLNEASTSISTLRKYIERNSKTKEIRQRDILIFKLLREIEKDGFKQNKQNKNAAKLLKDLSDNTKTTAWNYYTPELIPFHEWVMTRPVKPIY